ncbi:MAG: iron chelate uptake ABC transporter family permease subunit, partial [Streptococcaceae bacterium]|nr:iron chelate uptake ABC transporter family permease subunit [Streptococcaceae bacterium]
MKIRYLFLLLIMTSILSLFIGVSNIHITDIFNLSQQQLEILRISRFPRLISILVAGASLSICGLIMQQLLQNKFVSPTTAGTMEFARLGVLVAMLFLSTQSPIKRMIFAFLFALGGNLVFVSILGKIKFKDTIFVPLTGLMLGNVVGSISTFVAYQNNLIQNMSSWLQGDFSIILQGRFELLYLSIPLLIVSYLFADKFMITAM